MKRFGIEPLGLVISRESGIRVPSSVETSPISARDWEAAVGSRIAARARPFRLDRGILFVRTASATWAQELSLLSEAILAQLRGRGIEVEGLRFRVGHVDAPARPPTRDEVRTSPPEVPLPPTILDSLAHITDPELRDAIAHAAAKNLGWQSTREPKRKKKAPATSAPSAAPAPRSAGTGSGPPARRTKTSPAASRGKSGPG